MFLNDKTLKLSIVIPVLNAEDYLEECLNAIASQTVQPDEVIVVDNGSSDETVAIAKKFAFVEVLHEPRRGIAYARNRGFNAGKGDIIGRIDADSRLAADWVATAKRIFTQLPDAAAVAGGLRFYQFPFPRFSAICFSFLYYGIQSLIAGTVVLLGGNMAIRRRAWLKVQDDVHNGNDVHEDIDLSLRLKAAGLKIIYRRHLQASVSILGGDLKPTNTLVYVKRWHKTYLKNRLYGRAAIIWLIKAALIPMAFVFFAVSKPFIKAH